MGGFFFWSWSSPLLDASQSCCNTVACAHRYRIARIIFYFFSFGKKGQFSGKSKIHPLYTKSAKNLCSSHFLYCERTRDPAYEHFLEKEKREFKSLVDKTNSIMSEKISAFLTPIKRKISRGASSGEYSSQDGDTGKGKNENEEEKGEEESHADEVDTKSKSWKNFQQRSQLRNRRGSLLHRNSERPDHLKKLYIKRRISEAVIDSLTKRNDREALQRDIEAISEQITEDDSLLVTLDASLIKELKDEVELEMDKEAESAKIQELNKIGEKYTPYFQGLGEYPLEVRLQKFSYSVLVNEDNAKIQTVYNASCLYPLTKFVKRMWHCERKAEKVLTEKQILNNIHLVFKPGRQYLILGAPGSGKTTLLRAIAGILNPPKSAKIEGTISYSGRTLKQSDEFHIENAFAYIDQLDMHAARLTVEETFEFAYQCLTGGRFIREKVSPQVDQAIHQADKDHLATKLVLASLGLTEVKDTFVGDTNVRGVSGGQRRRVTVGEMYMSRAPVICGDEISTGLDAASTYDMIQVMLHYGRRNKGTRIISLLQPSPETVSLFDEVIVLAEGNIIYAGPVEEVEDYFAGIGFKSPEFTDVADFLQFVATEEGAKLYDPEPHIKAIRPKAPNPQELANIFHGSKLGESIDLALSAPLSYVWNQKEGSSYGHAEISRIAKSESVQKKYANKFLRSTALIIHRFIILWLRDKRVMIAGAVKNILMGVSVGGVFYNTTDALSIQGSLFQGGLFIMLGKSMPQELFRLVDLLTHFLVYRLNAELVWSNARPFDFLQTRRSKFLFCLAVYIW